MSQVSVCSANAHGRSPWRALRPVLVLGGFAAIWWALMTGVAQADSTPHHSLVDHVRSQVKAQPEEQDHADRRAAPVRDAVRRVDHDAKSSSSKARHQGKESTRSVTRTVSSVVESTPLAPVTTRASETLRTTASRTVATTRAVLAKTHTGSAVDTVEGTAKDATEKSESSTEQGNSHSPRHSTKAPTTSFAELISSAPGQLSASSAATGQARATSDADGPLDGPRGAPPVHDPCASPSGSSSSSFTPVAVTELSWLGTPSVLRDLRSWRLARPPGGPAYQPGSSPD